MACGDPNLLFLPSGQLSSGALTLPAHPLKGAGSCCPPQLYVGEILTVPRLLLQPAELSNYVERYSKRQILLLMR